jgi:uncharacterized membrane protein
LKVPARKKRKSQPPQKSNPKRNYFIATVVAGFVYTALMSYLSIIRFESFSASTYDLGIMLQTVWNTAHGWILQESVNMGYPMMRFWMAHWEFIYLPIALIYVVFQSPYTVLIVQSLAVASGALPIFWLGRDVFKDASVGFTFASLYLIFPAIQNANLCDIHGVTFAAPFLAYSFYFLYKKQVKLFALFSILALASREDSALILVMLGVYAFIFMKEKKLGAATIILSALWFFVWYKRMTIRALIGLPEFVIMEGADTHWSHLSQTASDFLYPLKHLAKKDNVEYFLIMLGPLLFFSLLSLETLLLATPIFAINLLSNYHYTHGIEHYYSATIVPFVFISAILGLKRGTDWIQKRFYKGKKPHEFRMNLLAGLTTGMIVISGVLLFMKSNAFDFPQWKTTPHHQVVKKIIEMIPSEASLTALDVLAPHAANRHELYVFEDNIGKVDYVLYDFNAKKFSAVVRTSFTLPFFWPFNEKIEALLRNRDYGIIACEDGVVLFKKGADYEAGLLKLAYAHGAEVQRFSGLEVNESLKLIGFRQFDAFERGFNLESRTERYTLKMLHFTTFWSTRQEYADDYTFVYKIHNPAAEYLIDHTPVFGLLPTSSWAEGELVRDEIFWVAPREMSAGTYTVSVAAIHLNQVEESPETVFFPIFEIQY